MGTVSDLRSKRKEVRELETALAKLRGMLSAYRTAFDAIAEGQEILRLSAGFESANTVLRLAAGLDHDGFERWLVDVEATVTPRA